jgi:adenylosuccinate synthase
MHDVPVFVLIFIAVVVLLLVHSHGVNAGHNAAVRRLSGLMRSWHAGFTRDALGRIVWNRMLVDAHEPGKKTEMLDWKDLHDEDRRLILRAADATFAIMDHEYQRQGVEQGAANTSGEPS